MQVRMANAGGMHIPRRSAGVCQSAAVRTGMNSGLLRARQLRNLRRGIDDEHYRMRHHSSIREREQRHQKGRVGRSKSAGFFGRCVKEADAAPEK